MGLDGSKAVGFRAVKEGTVPFARFTARVVDPDPHGSELI
jgi:hypothetical protein